MESHTFLYESKRLSPAQARAFISAFVGWVFDFYEIILLTFLIVPISRDLHLSPSHIAYVFSTQLLFLAIGGVTSGLLADRYGRRPILMWTIIIYTVGTLARAFTFNEVWLLLWTAFAALGIGGEYAVGQTLVSEVMPANRRGWWSGILYAGNYGGIVAASLVGGYLAPIIGWRWTFAVSALPILFALYVRASAPESDVWEMKKKNVKTNWRAFTRRSFLKPFFLCLVAAMLQFFAYYGITAFLPTYLVKQGFSLGKAAWWLFFTNAFSGLVGSLVGSYTSDRWGRRVTLSYLAATAATGGLVLFLTWRYLLTSSWILVPFFFLYFGSNGATVFGVLFSEMFPTEVRTTGVASALQIGRGMAFIPPLITAAIFPVYGYAPIVLMGAAEFGLLAIWAWVFKETRGKSILEIDRESETSPQVSLVSSQAE
jgi:putative MFS transporter